MVTLKLPAHQIAALNKRAAELSITRSAVVRQAIEALLSEEAVTA
jgi:metal-responsive CopG/Arc/MetJ family transcriptional regulator